MGGGGGAGWGLQVLASAEAQDLLHPGAGGGSCRRERVCMGTILGSHDGGPRMCCPGCSWQGVTGPGPGSECVPSVLL